MGRECRGGEGESAWRQERTSPEFHKHDIPTVRFWAVFNRPLQRRRNGAGDLVDD
jgi:hypothetical protein